MVCDIVTDSSAYAGLLLEQVYLTLGERHEKECWWY
jgi:hypothetical protein